MLATKARLSLPPFPFNNNRLLEGLVLYVPLWHEKLSGGTFASFDHNHHACTVTGATWGTQGRTFAGDDNDVITVANNDVFDITGAITIVMWVYPTDGVLEEIFLSRETLPGWTPVGYYLTYSPAGARQI